ncbi:hypothetical protein KOW79_013577 [Hemibagrus wyckioides]|uniref:Uncharacterized protein n=1 Tax=Hemibagrus wyckioides TaxID=337641 RepID=A0A9D3NGF0_9TELE|nr:hypothetical protein KOW79_013577 [Hemibagrus wyckioides]
MPLREKYLQLHLRQLRDAQEYKLMVISRHVEKFNKDKAKLGHFKMNSCGMNIIDLYRMAGTREIKFACTSMKLNDVATFVIAQVRELHGKPPKDTRKLHKLTDVRYIEMDKMIEAGGESLMLVQANLISLVPAILYRSMMFMPQLFILKWSKLVPHPYQPFNKCFADSRMLIAHYADRDLVNSSGKLVIHSIVDYCLPRHMYSCTLSDLSLEECREHLLCHVESI